jgi:hypothetical protein
LLQNTLSFIPTVHGRQGIAAKNVQLPIIIRISIPSNQPLFSLFSLQFESIGVANDESNRRDLREMLFTSPDIEKYISGVVRYNHLFHQNINSSSSFSYNS